MTVNGPVGEVQTFSNNGRMVLAITHTGDISLVDRTDYIRSRDGRVSTQVWRRVCHGRTG